MAGITDWAITQTPIAVLDVETTGTNPGLDQIVELSVIRLNPQTGRPEVAFDSLLNPRRAVRLTHVHGIKDYQLKDAPTFQQVAAQIAESLAGAVVAGCNVYYDVRFVEAGFRRLGIEFGPPTLCAISLRPVLTLGSRMSLEDMCRHHGIQLANEAHVAAVDATATALIMLRYFQHMTAEGIRTFGQLAARADTGRYRFLQSFDNLPLAAAEIAKLPQVATQTKSRADQTALSVFGTGSHVTVRREDYQTALLHAVIDLHLTADELAHLKKVRDQQGLTEEQTRGVHAAVFAWYITSFLQDAAIGDHERDCLARLHSCLRTLGWAPGV